MKWLVWVPWLKTFFTTENDEWMTFSNEQDGRVWVMAANARFSPCVHGEPCKKCRYALVPWDAQATVIMNGVLP
jgi:hypothetical protein